MEPAHNAGIANAMNEARIQYVNETYGKFIHAMNKLSQEVRDEMAMAVIRDMQSYLG